MKRVAILFPGKMRSNSLNPFYKDDDIIINSIKKYLLNNSFKNNYDYDIYFSTDTIDLLYALKTFGNNLKNVQLVDLDNVHSTENDWYLNEIKHKIKGFEYYKEKYLKIDFKNEDKCLSHINQYYRLYCAYNMAKCYEEENNIKYDYFIRIRPDSRLMQDVSLLFEIMETTNKLFITEHEQIYIVKPELQEIFKLIEYYGYFTITDDDYLKIHEKLIFDIYRPHYKLIYSPRFGSEMQFFTYLNYILNKNNYCVNDTFIGIPYPCFNILYRGNGNYGYIESPNFINWTPLVCLNDVLNRIKLDIRIHVFANERTINDWYNIHDTVIFKHIFNVGYDLDMKVDGTEINVPLEENDIVIFCFDNYDDNYFLTIKNNIKNLNLHTFIYNENIEDVKVKEKCLENNYLYLEKNKKKVIKEILKEIL